MTVSYRIRLPMLVSLALLGTLPACASWNRRDKGAASGATAGAIIGHQMDQQAKELQQNIPGAKVERVGEGIQVTFDSGILFALNSAVVHGAALQNLQVLASSLNQYPGSDLLIVGHTDSLGTDSYNATLSERRSQAAADVLASAGVARTRLQSLGRGETLLVSDNGTDQGRQLNRRVEVAIYASEAQRAAAVKKAGSP